MVTSSQNSKASSQRSDLQGEGRRIAVVASRFNETITKSLLEGALDALKEAGLNEQDILVQWVPGAFELPLALQAIANTEKFDAAVALGAVIRGETSHFDFVAGEASRGIQDVMLKTGLPIGFGLLTTETVEQAEARAGGSLGNKGFEAAQVALEMVQELEGIDRSRH